VTTWNPSDKSANIVLSNGNLTSAANTTADGAVRSTTSKSSGKVYFEVAWTGSGGADTSCGIATSAAILGSAGNSTMGICAVFLNGNIWFNGAAPGNAGGAVGNGTVCFAVDLTNSRFWARINNGNWNNNSANNPATNVGGINIATLFPTNAAFGITTYNSTVPTSTVNFGGTAFGYTVPSGFAAWDPPPPPPGGQTAVTINTG